MKEINIEKHLSLYHELKIGKSELQQDIGENLHNVECRKSSCKKQSYSVRYQTHLQN